MVGLEDDLPRLARIADDHGLRLAKPSAGGTDLLEKGRIEGRVRSEKVEVAVERGLHPA